MKNLIILIILILLTVVFLKMAGIWDGKKIELPRIIGDRAKKAIESIDYRP